MPDASVACSFANDFFGASRHLAIVHYEDVLRLGHVRWLDLTKSPMTPRLYTVHQQAPQGPDHVAVPPFYEVGNVEVGVGKVYASIMWEIGHVSPST